MAGSSFWLDQYDRKANQPLTWRLAGDNLLVAAEVLFRAYRDALSKPIGVGGSVPKGWRLLSPILLLRAAALEALLKGRAVRRGHRFVVQGSFCPIPKAGKGHDLVQLADATAFRLNQDERDMLSRLSPQLELARYPVGKFWQTGLKKDPRPGVGHVLGAYYVSSDEAVFARLVKRLRRAVQ